MGKLGRLLVGTAVLGAAAAGAYEYLKENGKIPGVVDGKAEEMPAEEPAAETSEAAEAEEIKEETTAEANEETAAEQEEAKEEAEEAPETEEAAEAEPQTEDTRSDVEKAVNDFAQEAWGFAKRTYTTVKVGAGDLKEKVDSDVIPRVKDAIGPKGTEILSTVGETAGKFKDVTVDSAKRIHEIVKEEPEKHYSTVETPEEEEAAEAPAEAAEEVTEAAAETAEEAAEAVEEAAETAEEAAEAVEEAVETAEAVEEAAETEEAAPETEEPDAESEESVVEAVAEAVEKAAEEPETEENTIEVTTGESMERAAEVESFFDDKKED